jgi:hypothetical protein
MLAHQGGWDETLLIIGPMFVVFMLLRLAKRRVERQTHVYESPDVPPADPIDERDDGITP